MEEKLINAATETLNRLGDGKNHTVAAAVATKNGKIITGVNMSHFTGGPCGEISAVINAISAGEKDIIAVATIGDNDRGVLAPCGRCRQVLLDYYPDIVTILKENETLVARPIRDMLPGAYKWERQQADMVE